MYLNIFPFLLPPKTLDVNKISLAQCPTVASSNYVITVRQFYIEVKKTDAVKSYINYWEIKRKSSTFKKMKSRIGLNLNLNSD